MYQSWVEISKKAIIHNLNSYQKLVGSRVAVMPVIKSNAYGHGMIEIANIVAPKISWLGVASGGEALALRQSGVKKNILVLSYFDEKDLSLLIGANIVLPAYDFNLTKKISQAATKLKKQVDIHLRIDSGETRLGFLSKDITLFPKIFNLPGVNIQGAFSHFASSEDNSEYTKLQYNNFQSVLNHLKHNGIFLRYIHFGCSSGSVTHVPSRYNMVRLGIGLYGLWPDKRVRKLARRQQAYFDLKPALQWKSRVIQVKKITKGTSIGYGCTFTAPTDMTIAVVGVGYWDGYDRKLSNQGMVYVRNKPCRVVGRICMNIMMINVSKVLGVKRGDVVILLGGKETADDIAQKIGTINYEVLTRINSELKRVYF